MSSIEEIKDRLNIEDIVSETVELRRSGKNFSGFCPFHSNTRTPSFVVFPETGTWRCFGQCSEGGDIYKFVMKREGWDFPETLSELAKKAGVQLKPPTREEQAKKDGNEKIRAVLEKIVSFYRQQLWESEAGKEVLDYIRGRGLTDTTIKQFELGYSPQGWETTINLLKQKGISEQDMVDAGVATKKDEGGYFDKFRHRVMFPIRDSRGRMAGFGARALSKDENAKYLNSPLTSTFDKGHLLYGLDHARKAIRSEDGIVIVEGYFDVIALHQAGYANTVSPMGTALTDAQIRQLKRYTRNITLALDADAAGNNATLRGLQVARESMDHELDPVFNPRGLIRNESRLQADIRVTTLPSEKDPDDVVNESPENWELILKAAKPIVVHVMEALADGRDLEDPKTKSEIAKQVIPLIQDIPSAIERDSYLQRLARFLRVSEEALLQEHVPTKKRVRRRVKPAEIEQNEQGNMQQRNQEHSGTKVAKQLEMHSLGIMVRHPELLYRVDRALGEAGLERTSSTDYSHTDHQVIFRIALEAINQNDVEPLAYVLENIPESLIDIADYILEKSEELDPNEERVFEDLLRTLIKMRRNNITQGNEQLRFLQQEIQEQGDEHAIPYQQAIVSAVKTLNYLDKALGKYTGSSVINN